MTKPTYGRTFLCHNNGPFHMRQIVVPGEPTQFVDAALARAETPEKAIARGWASPQLISPDAEPTEVQ